MSNPLLSTLIPCYNHEKFITDTIKSIWAQNISDMEIIVIDDGSKDSSFKVLKDLQKLSPIPMHIYTQENAGIVKTLNRCLAKAKGKYISLIGSDDQYFPDVFSTLLNTLEKDENLKVIFANAREFKEDELFEKMHHTQTQNLLALPPMKIEKRLRTEVPRPLLTQCAIYEKGLLDGVNGWDESLMLDDWPLNIEVFSYLTKYNFYHKFMDIDLIKYRFHDNNMHKNVYKMYLMIEEVILKHSPNEIKKQFLAEETYNHGSNLLKGIHPFIGAKLLYKSQFLDFKFLKFLNVVRLTTKYTLRAIFTNKRH